MIYTSYQTLERKAMKNSSTHLTHCIRHIEGTITNIVAMASLSNVKIDMELAGSIIISIGNVKQARITIPTIIQVVTKYYNIKPDELRAKRWRKSTSIARQIAIY